MVPTLMGTTFSPKEGNPLRKHPVATYLFVWSCDLIALVVVVLALLTMPEYSKNTWFDFAIWTAIMCIARLGSIPLFGLNVNAGVATAFEFAAILVLPLPLYCLTILVSSLIIALKRVYEKHPEPFLGPDFNAANLIISALVASQVYTYVSEFLTEAYFGPTFAILPTALVYEGIQVMLLTILLSIDQQRPWRKVGSLDPDALFNDSIMLIAGAIIGRIYHLEAELLFLMLLPLLFLHKTFDQMNKAKLAYIDGKTGLHNYRHLDEQLNELVSKATPAQPLALIFGDMDHLRDINNTYGHPTGDQALIVVARAFSNACIDDAVAARFGGEEFVLLLPGTSKFHAAEIAEQVRSAVEQTAVTLENGDPLHLTISLGVASYPDDAHSVEELVKAADEAVYAAKHTGRNRVCIYGRRDNVPETDIPDPLLQQP